MCTEAGSTSLGLFAWRIVLQPSALMDREVINNEFALCDLMFLHKACEEVEEPLCVVAASEDVVMSEALNFIHSCNAGEMLSAWGSSCLLASRGNC